MDTNSTGGAYYLYKQKGVDSNPDSTVETKAATLVETAKKDLPTETDPKLQDIVKSKMPGFSQDDQKDLTRPTPTKDSSENKPIVVQDGRIHFSHPLKGSIRLHQAPSHKILAPSFDIMVVFAKSFDTQSFSTLFGLGWGAESTLLSITLYLMP